MQEGSELGFMPLALRRSAQFLARRVADCLLPLVYPVHPFRLVEL